MTSLQAGISSAFMFPFHPHVCGELEMAVFAGSQINSLSTAEYIRFFKAMIKDADIINMRRLALEYLHILDLKISILELGIAYTELYEELLKEKSSHSAGPEKGKVLIKDMSQQTREKAKQILEQIEQLKKEKEALLSYPDWNHFGGILDEQEIPSFLTPELEMKYRTC